MAVELWISFQAAGEAPPIYHSLRRMVHGQLRYNPHILFAVWSPACQRQREHAKVSTIDYAVTRRVLEHTEALCI